ncbi:MAG: glucuronate isomerase [Oscillospiraceae bacterium]|nr:glucuronate isomerase [Oscillospiraceae bacterium]
MKPFLSKKFLLTTSIARTLYWDYAAKQPIIDYHCHIDPREIYEDRRFEDLAQLWLGGDHYKWRLLRANGVEEKYVTGDADGWEKFRRFAAVLPKAIGNPMVHWCHLELKNYFGWEGFLCEETAREVWELCNEKLRDDPDFTARGFVLRSNVEMIGTTDDPCDSLEWHEKLAADESFPVKVCPTFRPDKALQLHKPGFAAYIQKLSETVGYPLNTVEDVKRALSDRIAYFAGHGCRAADHGLDYVSFRRLPEIGLNLGFQHAMSGGEITVEGAEAWQTELLLHCAGEYARRGMVMQLHYSCLRNPNSRAFASLGPDTGFDCIALTNSGGALAKLLDELEKTDSLPRTILYSLNPGDNAFLDTLIGSFQGPGIPGKLQHGSAWWFNDNKAGMTEHLTSLANQGLLGNFIGMLTDSRSFLSYARHEYFRRILCNLLGDWAENGEYPNDPALLGSLVEDICYKNAKRYFNL